MKIINRIVITVVSLLVIVFRDYTLFSAPRFWAEEGAFWFSYAFSHDWFSVIFANKVGYYNFYCQFAALLASRVVPLEHAPIITTIMAFLVQYIAIMIVVWDNSSLWNTTLKKAVMSAIILFTPRTPEIWLNTNGSQYFLSLISILILLSDNTDPSLFKKYFYRMLLIISGLTGLLSCGLIFLFVLKAWKLREKETYVQATILAICCLVHILTIFVEQSRQNSPTITTAAFIVWVRVFLAPFSMTLANTFSKYVFWMYEKSIYHIVGSLVIVAQAAILWIFTRQIAKPKNILIIGSFIFLSYFSTYFGIGAKENMALLNVIVGNRYFYVPGVLILSMMLFSIDFKSNKILSNVLSGIFTLLLIIGLLNGQYWFRKEKLKKETWTNWRDEVMIWKENPYYKPKIWPTGWKIKLYSKTGEFEYLWRKQEKEMNRLGIDPKNF